MKKSVLLSLGIIGLMVASASATPISLYTTTEDFAQWSAGSTAMTLQPVDATFGESDASNINGIGNTTAAGAVGTAGSVLISPVGGWTGIGYGPGENNNQTFLDAIDPGAVAGVSTAAATGVIGFDYQFTGTPNTWFQFGILLSYTGNSGWGSGPTFVNSDYSFTGADGFTWNHVDVPYTIVAGSLTYLSIGLYENTGGLTTPVQFDNFVIVPEPTTFALVGLGAAALLIFRRK